LLEDECCKKNYFKKKKTYSCIKSWQDSWGS
jgi:hypothetical protein